MSFAACPSSRIRVAVEMAAASSALRGRPNLVPLALGPCGRHQLADLPIPDGHTSDTTARAAIDALADRLDLFAL
jgi:hypothetical protein